MNRLRAFQYLAVLTISVSHFAIAEDWPTFRGTQRTAVSSEVGLLDSWGSDGPQLLFAAKGVGRGYASPAVANGRIFTLGDGPSTADDSDEYLTCFDASDGELIWMQKTGPAWNEGRTSWQGSRSTPTVDGELVFVLTPFGKLIAAKVDDGEIVWQRNLKDEFGGSKADPWGYSESPLVDGDQVVCTPGGSDSTVVALNRASGQLIWKCVRPDDLGAGHSSVVISHPGGRKVYVQNTAGGPLGIDAETGELLWDYDRERPTAFIPTPIVSSDLVFSVSGYGRGGALLQQVVNDDNSISIQEIYAPDRQLANKHGGVVLVDGFIYAGYEDKNELYCADLQTGERKWEATGPGRGSLSVAVADGKLYVRSQDGTVALAKVDAAGYEEISSFKTPGSGDRDKPSWAHPVIANGRLLLREDDSILCYNISEAAEVLGAHQRSVLPPESLGSDHRKNSLGLAASESRIIISP